MQKMFMSVLQTGKGAQSFCLYPLQHRWDPEVVTIAEDKYENCQGGFLAMEPSRQYCKFVRAVPGMLVCETSL